MTGRRPWRAACGEAKPRRLPSRIVRLSLLGALFGVLACAPQAGAPRSSSARGQIAPGWIEFVLEDRDIPADPLAGPGAAAKAPTCDLEILLDRESVISLTLHPRGDAPPYALDSRFTIRAAPGDYSAVVHYSSCRNDRNRPDSREVAISLSVVTGNVTRAHFDGTTLTSRWPEPTSDSAD